MIEVASVEVYSFGNNMYGQLGLGENKNTAPGQLVTEKKPTLINLKKNIKHIVCGLDNTILATGSRTKSVNEIYVLTSLRLENEIYGMGWSADGQLGQGKEDKDVPSKLDLSIQIKKLSSSTDFTLALDQDGRLWTWGNSEYGQGIQGKIIDRVREKQGKTKEEKT